MTKTAYWSYKIINKQGKIFQKLKYIFTKKKTTPQLLGHIGLQNMKVGVKANFG